MDRISRRIGPERNPGLSSPDSPNFECSTWIRPEPSYRTGILGKYARLVSSSSKGAVTDQPD